MDVLHIMEGLHDIPGNVFKVDVYGITPMQSLWVKQDLLCMDLGISVCRIWISSACVLGVEAIPLGKQPPYCMYL